MFTMHIYIRHAHVRIATYGDLHTRRRKEEEKDDDDKDGIELKSLVKSKDWRLDARALLPIKRCLFFKEIT